MDPFKPRRVILTRPAWEPLTSPSENTYNRTWPPLSSLYIATGLRQRGIDASVVDLQAARRPAARALAGLGPHDLVFLSTADVDRWQCPNDLRLSHLWQGHPTAYFSSAYWHRFRH